MKKNAQAFLSLFAQKHTPLALTLLCFGLALFSSQRANASPEGMTIIRDAEIEHYLRTLGQPIFRAAGLDPSSISLVIIQDPAINAFVAGGQNIFFFTGLLQETETPDELLGVIAHETGHIAGGHLVRGTAAMKNASAEVIIGMLAGLAAGLATGRADVTIGAIGGAQEITARTMMSYSRAQESSADAAALSFLDKTGQGAAGMLSFMKKLSAQELLPADRQAEYVRTHPFSQNRVSSIAFHLEHQGDIKQTIDPRLITAHERMKAKLLGFIQPQTALLRYTDKDPRIAPRYARAIALYRTHQLERALALMDKLLKDEPDNPFFHELRGQMLFENGRIEEASQSYATANQLLPDSPLLLLAYAGALLEGHNASNLDRVIEMLLTASRLEERIPQTWRQLSIAWGRKMEANNDNNYQGLIYYARAEETLALDQKEQASRYADQAISKLTKGSPYWIRAQDIKLTAANDAKD